MNYPNLLTEHYSKTEVQNEIVEFCKERWVAVHFLTNTGKLVFRRYFKSEPLTIEEHADILKLLKHFNYKIRSFYATANKYQNIKYLESFFAFSNIKSCTPTWDIDNAFSNWNETVKTAREIVAFLEKEGVQKSVYVKWSGNGCHVHIHENAFSNELLTEKHPLDIAYAIVEYVNSKLSTKFAQLSLKQKIKVENNMDSARVFTCPLSLHRELNVVCICMKPNQLDDFTIEWTNPSSFKHNKDWRNFLNGEADSLALKAYNTIGGYPYSSKPIKHRKMKRLDEQIRKWLHKS